MIRKCKEKEFEAIYTIINEAASAYEDVIPEDCWHVPYMSKEELKNEIDRGVVFWCYEENNKLIGVMGNQSVQDINLIRHSYVLTSRQNQGIGRKLLSFLLCQTNCPILVGTWASATWAISFYKKHGFTLVSEEENNKLFKKYWTIPTRQIETSVVLADERWIKRNAQHL